MKTKNSKVYRQTSTFDVQIADTLFSENPSKIEESHRPIIESTMKRLGGNWKRLIRGNCSYYVSDLGKVINKDGSEQSYKIQNNGYISWKYTTVHRLVCYAFGKIKTLKYDPNNPEEIDHIDEDKTNNALTNLRVVSHKENIAKRDRYGFKRCVKVDAYDYETSKFICTYNSYKEAASALNTYSSLVCNCVHKKMAQSNGYGFAKHGEEYVKMNNNSIIRKSKPNKVKTIYFNHPRIEMWKDGELYKTVSSFAEISNITGSDRHVISERLKNNSTKPLRGYTFKYVEKKGEN